MRLTLTAINNELAKHGHTARLAKVSDYYYYYFHFGEAGEWLDRAVRVPTLSSLTLEQWRKSCRAQDSNQQNMTSRGSGGVRSRQVSMQQRRAITDRKTAPGINWAWLPV